MPLTHGLTMTMSVYESAAFFIRNNTSRKEFLFFGDVEPDSISSKPRTIDVWKVAASKIPETLSAIFIECSWPSGREDKMLHGHLSPEHLVDELVVLARETYKFNEVSRRKSSDDYSEEMHNGPVTRSRKRLNSTSVSSGSLRGILNELYVYIMHCKGDVDGIYDRPINHIIADQVKALLQSKELGVRIVVVEQGMHIREYLILWFSLTIADLFGIGI
jgi:cAMP phosphodiesterase